MAGHFFLGSSSPLLRLKINIFAGDWLGGFFSVLCLLVGTGRYPPPYFRSFGMNTLAAIPARSFGNKDLEVKSLSLKDLASFSLRTSALGSLPLLPPGVGPPFHPEQKVKS